MKKFEEKIIEEALRESKDFSKEIRQYIYDISKERALTQQEQKIFKLTHDVHVHTNDAILLLRK